MKAINNNLEELHEMKDAFLKLVDHFVKEDR